MFGINTAKRLASGVISNLTGASGGTTASGSTGMSTWGASTAAAPPRMGLSALKAFNDGRSVTGSMMDAWKGLRGRTGANQNADIPGLLNVDAQGTERSQQISDSATKDLGVTTQNNIQEQDMAAHFTAIEALAKGRSQAEVSGAKGVDAVISAQ